LSGGTSGVIVALGYTAGGPGMIIL
jgi:hypothetical protein